MMWMVQTQISDTHNSFDANRTGTIYHLMQAHYSLDKFIDNIEAHQQAQLQSVTSPQRLTNETIRTQFNELANAFFVFTDQTVRSDTPQPQMDALVARTQQFFETEQPLIDSEQPLDAATLERILADTYALSKDIRQLGNDYFVSETNQTREAKADIATLSGYMRLFFALLILTSGFGIAILIRSNVRTSILFKEAHHARSELALTVDELRSGRREQKAKDSFIAAANHDLRQPMHALGLFLNTLQQEVKPGGEYALREAENCVLSLNQLFDGMLDLSQLDAGVIANRPEHFDLHTLLNNLHAQLEPAARARNIQLTVSGPTESIVKTDPSLLERIIRNLIENTFAHSGATHVWIRYTALRQGYSLSITDNGCGIDTDEQAAVFDEYYQIHSPERDRSQGLGLGLSIVKRFSDLLNLNLTLESNPGADTKFSMLIPLGDIKEIEPPRDPANITPLQAHHAGAVIVVIDDERSIRDAMGVLLAARNYQVVCAKGTEDALEQLADRQLAPDLILADYRLNDSVTGDQVIHELRDAVENNVPGLIVTGDTFPARVSELTSTGFEILHKPVDSELLQARISELLKENHHLDEKASSAG